jgi:hypothetical protein
MTAAVRCSAWFGVSVAFRPRNRIPFRSNETLAETAAARAVVASARRVPPGQRRIDAGAAAARTRPSHLAPFIHPAALPRRTCDSLKKTDS